MGGDSASGSGQTLPRRRDLEKVREGPIIREYQEEQHSRGWEQPVQKLGSRTVSGVLGVQRGDALGTQVPGRETQGLSGNRGWLGPGLGWIGDTSELFSLAWVVVGARCPYSYLVTLPPGWLGGLECPPGSWAPVCRGPPRI